MITKENVKDIYGLSPLQEGMLFHSLMNPDSEAYFEQMEYRIFGELSIELFERSWNEVIRHYDILRTAFVHNKTEKPIQIVLRERPIVVRQENLMGLDELEQAQLIKAYKEEDKRRGFELDKEALIRLTVFRINRNEHRIVWSHHHILLDGWSVVKIKSDFLETYKRLEKEVPVQLPSVRPYSQYIKWLGEQNNDLSLSFWKERLKGYEAQASIPFAKSNQNEKEIFDTCSFQFSIEETSLIQSVASNVNITLNTFIQSIWGILLSFYNDTTDVVFGTTVSGRPISLAGVEDMVGLFINTIPVRMDRKEGDSFKSFALRSQQMQLMSEEHQYLQLSEIQSVTALKNQLFDHILVFENYPVGESLSSETSDQKSLRIESVDQYETTNYAFNLLVLPGEELSIKFMFNTEVFCEESIDRIKGHFKKVISQAVEDPTKLLSEFEYLTSSEETTLLEELAKSSLKSTEDGQVDSILELIKKRVEEIPQLPAVSYENTVLTYKELDCASNRVANYLKNNLNLAHKASVGVMLNRSEQLIVGILGVLKAGASYVSLDPKYPQDRIRFILDALNIETVLCDQEQPTFSDYDSVKFVPISETSAAPDDDLKVEIAPDQTMYTLFTSGSTGEPKGVSVSHKNVVACTEGLNQLVNQYDTALATTSINFDVSVSELLIPLTMGKKVRVLNNHSELPKWIEQEKNVFVMTIPSVMEAIWESGIESSNISCLGLAGDVFPRNLATKLLDSSIKKVVNLYGPTEDTIYSTYFDINDLKDDASSVSIGRPILHTNAYILSREQKLLPVGITGELYLSGKKISTGYVNRPEETKKRFLPHPFNAEERIYRTGDLVRWLDDGNIEFLGRIDSQVKLNGFRVELEEIEHVLGQEKGVLGVKTLAFETPQGGKKLMAYYTGEKLPEELLKSAIANKVPYYMVPDRIVHLEEFPLNANGKIDSARLPRETENVQKSKEVAPPETEMEQILLEVWQHVLLRNDIGVTDNYYHLGGDSIKAIQIIAGLFKRSYKAEIKDLFTYKTIRAWAPYIKDKEQLADQQLITGTVPLAPIQHWFFESIKTARNHFNQSTLLKARKRLDSDIVDRLLKALSEHHDALRMTFVLDGNEVQQKNQGSELFARCQLIDLTEFEDYTIELGKHAKEIQASFDLEKGPLMKGVIYRTRNADLFFLCVHHLVIDGVSWRILQEDFQQLYSAYSHNESSSLGAKTHSYKSWSEELHKFAFSKELSEEKHYWKKVLSQETTKLPKKALAEPLNQGQMSKCQKYLTVNLTNQLLNETHRAYNSEMNDVLLTALSSALNLWTNGSDHCVTLEGHGRETFQEEVNISRTVGWFTTMYPIMLATNSECSIGDNLIATKEMLRRIPRRGLGYGCLRYLGNENDPELNYESDILFNYLGEFKPLDENEYFEDTFEDVGPDFSYEGEVTNSIVINAAVYNGQMRIDCSYSNKQFEADELVKLLEDFTLELDKIVNHCLNQTLQRKTPSDFLYNQFDCEGLDNFFDVNNLKNSEVEDIYPLAPMQEGMFFHSQYNPESASYHEQMSFSIQGELDEEIFHTCWNELLQRYDVLRTRYFSSSCPTPVQVVMKDQEIDYVYEDWTPYSDRIKEERMEALLLSDRQRQFNLSEDALMRVNLIKKAENVWSVLWSYHHIMMDGWCSSIVQRAFFELYQAKIEQRKPNLEPAPLFRNYLEWLSFQDKQMYTNYWKEYLNDFERLTGIPELTSKSNNDDFRKKEYEFLTSKDLTDQLKEIVVKYELTMNTLLQTVWGILLSRYNNTNDVVFGATVSGRPSELDSVSEMVGLFINTIPVRINVDAKDTFVRVAQEVNERGIASKEYSYYSLARIQSDSMLQNRLLNHVLVYENYPIDQEIATMSENAALGFVISDLELLGQTNYDLAIAVMPKEGLHFEIGFNECLYSEKQIENVCGHLEMILNAIAENPEILIRDISIVTESEKPILLNQYNSEGYLYGVQEKGIVELFMDQVARVGQNVALIDSDEYVTFDQLNERSNQIANWLRDTWQIGEGDLVAVLSNHSYQSICVFLGVLKLGATYLPLSENGPAGRNQLILQSVNCPLILSNGTVEMTGYDLAHANWNDAWKMEVNGEFKPSQSNSPYLIYTSGTTGIPKGVEITQSGIINCVMAMIEVFNFKVGDRLLQFFPYTFDVSHYQVYQALLTGGTLVLANEEHRDNPHLLVDYMNKENVSVMGLPPAYFETLPLEKIQTVKTIYTGGEAPSTEFINRLLERGWRYFNLYGLTETSCNSTVYEVEAPISPNDNVPIGKAIANTEVSILTEFGQLQPIGAVGEICVAGKGLANGYYDDSELTALRFVPHPTKKGERLFRTGDLGKYDVNGNIVFVGRKDNQVSLRGHRIEIGEVEFILSSHESISRVAVVLNEYQGEKHLVAYFTSEQAVNEKELRKYLSNHLASPSIPSYWVQLDAIPFTQHGKVDKNALPSPDWTAIQHKTAYIAPSLPNEQLLAESWSDVLGIEEIGVKDNFFDLGGDSIKAIQIVSRIASHDLKLVVKDIFEAPTIAELALRVKESTSHIDQSSVAGMIPLTPIQNWFFEVFGTNESHFNQSILLESKKQLDPLIVEMAVNHLTEHHDALRMTFNNALQECQPVIESHVEFIDVSGELNGEKVLEDRMSELQTSFDLEHGPLMKVLVARTEERDKLFIVMHHLIVDGVSWRILMEDLQSAYEQLAQGKNLALPLKTTSYLDWSKFLVEYGDSIELHKQIDFWKKVEDKVQHEPRLVEENSVANVFCELVYESVEFSKNFTKQLMRSSGAAFRTEINDLLLLALVRSMRSLTGRNALSVSMEGHGREELSESIDISRTIGWFTTVFPIYLDIENEEDLSTQIKWVKENLRNIPQKGMGYGILKQYSSELKGNKCDPEISFNFLGEMSSANNGKGDFVLGSGNTGDGVAPFAAMPYELMINGIVTNDVLSFSCGFHPKRIDQKKIQGFIQEFKTQLEIIVDFCVNRSATELTPSDFLVPGMSLSDYNTLLESNNWSQDSVQNIYPLSPLQEGLFFHALQNDTPTAYFQQMSYRMTGTLNVEAFERAWQYLVDRYDMLRTAFIEREGEDPVQVVLKKLPFRIKQIDLSDLSDEEQFRQLQVEKEKSLNVPFEFNQAGLMRLELYRLNNSNYEVVWSYHHILMDGWCQGIIKQDFFEAYGAFSSGKSLDKTDAIPFTRYIQWLQKQDKDHSLNFWKEYLSVITEPTGIPKDLTAETPAKKGASIQLSTELFERIVAFVAQQQCTINVLIQTVWGTLLNKYNRTSSAVFGAIVSGRPSEINGVGEIVGLLINTIPVVIPGDEDLTVSELIRNVQNTALEAENHHHVSLAEIQVQTTHKRDLIDHIMIFENYPINKKLEESNALQEDVSFSHFEMHEQTTYGLVVLVIPGDTLEVRIEYDASMYDSRMIQQALNHFENILKSMVTDEKLSLSKVSIMDDQKNEFDLNPVLSNNCERQLFGSIPSVFEKIVMADPDARAVTYGAENVTYRELNDRSNRIAHALVSSFGIEKGKSVGILLQQGVDVISSILGILKAGGVYVPIDPEYPQDRIDFILQDSGALAVIATENQQSFPTLVPSECADSQFEPVKLNEEDQAYIIYTSGSTGVPKGVRIHHGAVLNLVEGLNKTVYDKYQGTLTVALMAATAFDASVQQIFGCLLNGHCLVLSDNNIKRDDLLFANFIESNNIDIMDATPSLLKLLLQGTFATNKATTLKHILVGGEVLTSDLVKSFFQRKTESICLTNVYGPTECTVDATYFHLTAETLLNGSTIPIGKALPNYELFILTGDNQPTPIRVPGEICISGKGLSKGYVNRAEITETKFVQHPFRDGEKMYRTGDLGYLNFEGNLVFLERMDSQVKIRGHRIELGEIESLVFQCSGIKQCTVQTRVIGGADELVVYYESTNSTNAEQLKDYLKNKLPGYAVPHYFVEIDKIPLTTNGKVDHRALTKLDLQNMSKEIVHPMNKLEEALLEIWKEVLGREEISVEASFFDLGGHSLSAMRLRTSIKHKLGLEVHISDIFNAPEIRKLAKRLEENTLSNTSRIFQLNNHKVENQTLFFIPPVAGTSLFYQPVAKLLEERYNCIGLQMRGLEESERHYTSINEIVQDFLTMLRKHQPEGGVYRLFGYSMGVNIALELCAALEEAGEKCELILADGNIDRIEEELLQVDFQKMKGSDLWDQAFELFMNDLSVDGVNRLEKLINNNLRLMNQQSFNYNLKADIRCFEARDSSPATEMFKLVSVTSGSFDHQLVPGNHYGMFGNEHLSNLAESILDKKPVLQKEPNS